MYRLVLLGLSDLAQARGAVALAAGLAARSGAGFAVEHVSAPLSRDGGCVLQLPGEADLAARRAEVEALCREAMPPGLTADVMAGAGFLHVELLKAARALGPDLLVLGGQEGAERCRRELSDAEAGAALLTAAGAPCPVLAVPPGARPQAGPFASVLAAVDLSWEAHRLMAVLDHAARLAESEGATLVVLHALRLAPDRPVPGHDEMLRRVGAARDRLAYLCRGLPGAGRFTLHVREGDPGQEVLKAARECAADLIVLAPRGDGRAAAATRVLDGAGCPVLLMGPQALAAAVPPQAFAAKG